MTVKYELGGGISISFSRVWVTVPDAFVTVLGEDLSDQQKADVETAKASRIKNFPSWDRFCVTLTKEQALEYASRSWGRPPFSSIPYKASIWAKNHAGKDTRVGGIDNDGFSLTPLTKLTKNGFIVFGGVAEFEARLVRHMHENCNERTTRTLDGRMKEVDFGTGMRLLLRDFRMRRKASQYWLWRISHLASNDVEYLRWPTAAWGRDATSSVKLEAYFMKHAGLGDFDPEQVNLWHRLSDEERSSRSVAHFGELMSV